MASAVSRSARSTPSACSGPWVHCVAVVCVTPIEGMESNGETSKRSNSQRLINAVLFAPILMDLFAKSTQGFV